MEGFLIIARFFHFSAVIMLTGVFAFERLVSGPAIRQSGATVASVAGLRRRLGWLAWACLALAIGSGAAWLVAVAAVMSGKPLGVALSQGAVPVVLTRTRFGEDWRWLCCSASVCSGGEDGSGGSAERSPGRCSSSPRGCWRASPGPAMVPRRPALPVICTSPRTSSTCSPPACGWERSRRSSFSWSR